jgi:putative DNA primase/helicase
MNTFEHHARTKHIERPSEQMPQLEVDSGSRKTSQQSDGDEAETKSLAVESGPRGQRLALQHCTYGGGRFEVTMQGVFFIGTNKDGNEEPARWICARLQVVAMTRDAKSGEWGRLLEWRDADGVRHQWAMPLELLQGDGADVRRELARQGLSIAPGRAARELLASFLQVWPVEERARCVGRLGWHGAVYVTPAESIGAVSERVVFQNAHATEPALSASGTAEEWRENVAALAVGNSRLVFALSVAFAGPLIDPAGEDSGGFHLRGSSSSGKTTALRLAASVWGSPSAYCRLWRATSNGLEGLAALHNDGLLALDELSQIDPKEAGEAAYLLANGQGKVRAARNGTTRQSASWRLLFISAGEESLSALMARAGKRPTAGQEIRLAEIDIDAASGMGVFEALNGYQTPAALATALRDAASHYYGAVGEVWLRLLVTDRPKLPDFILDGVRQFVKENVPEAAAGQIERVARRFGLVAVAGEIATRCRLTSWPQGAADEAAGRCFASWLQGFGGGTGNREDRALLAQVRAFFEQHGASRFEDVTSKDQRVISRAGFFRADAAGNREYLVLPEVFKQAVCSGFDCRAATHTLQARGWLLPGRDRATQNVRLPGIGVTRIYALGGRMWEDET